MKTKLMFILAAGLFLSLNSGVAVAGGGMQGGGGGKKEPLFEEIAQNIADWIKSGNADDIASVLPTGVSVSDYKSEMLAALSNYHVTFTDDKIMVTGSDGSPFEKTCKGYVDQAGVNQIVCNNGQFGTDSPENINEIYRQVHHEFAGLACKKDRTGYSCLEQNRNEESDYRISRHISGFLKQTQVMRLPVAPLNFEEQRSLFGKFMGCLGSDQIRLPGETQPVDRKIVVFRIGAQLNNPINFLRTKADQGKVLLITASKGDFKSTRLAEETPTSNRIGVMLIAQEIQGVASVMFSSDDYGQGSARIVDLAWNGPYTLSSVRLKCTDNIDVVSKAIDEVRALSPF